MNRLEDLARSQDAVAIFDDMRTEAVSAAERRLVDTGATPDAAALAVNLAVAAFVGRLSGADVGVLATSPAALALMPDLLPPNVVRFRREPR